MGRYGVRVWDGRRHSARFLAATTHAPLRAIKMRCPRFLFFLALVALCVASANALGGLGGVGGGVGDLADDAAEAAEEAFSPPSAVFEEEEEEPSGGGLFGGIASPSGGGLFGSPFEEEEEVIEEDPCECPAFEGCEVYEGQQVCMVDPSCPTATPTYRSFPGTHYVPCPLDVDCEGSWGNFGACEGQQRCRTFTVTAPSSATGNACPNTDGEEECDSEGCDVDCEGSWGNFGACEASPGGGQQRCRTFTVTIPGSGTGNACPNTDGEEECDSEGCAPPEPAPLPVPVPESTPKPKPTSTPAGATSATAFLGAESKAAKDLRIGGEVGRLANKAEEELNNAVDALEDERAPSTSQGTVSSDNIALLALEAAAGESLGREVEVWSTEPVPSFASLTFFRFLSLSLIEGGV